MCEAIAGLREAMGLYAAGFEPAQVAAADAARVVEDAATIEKMAATVKALAAARMADTDLWRHQGDRSAAHHLARTTGTTVGAAADALASARRLDRLGQAAAAARRGELSSGQVSAIADAASADPTAEARLVATARGSSLQELKDDCARTKAAATADAEARRKHIHDRRCLRTFTDAEGAWHMHVRNNPEVGAEIMAVIDPLRDRLFAQARTEGRREPTEAYAADALTTLARDAATAHLEHRRRGDGTSTATGTDRCEGDHSTDTDADVPWSDAASTTEEPAWPAEATGVDVTTPAPTTHTGGAAPIRRRTNTGARAKIIVRVDLPTLLRGYPVSGEVAELVGYGPVAVSVLRDLIDTGDPFLTAVVTRGIDVVGVAHLGRRPTAHQQTALEWLYPTCAVEGCSAVARLEMDHREDWAATHITLFSLIDRLCPHHHRLKTRENWGLVDGRGKRAFVPPTDQRHPRHGAKGRRVPAAAATGPPNTG